MIREAVTAYGIWWGVTRAIKWLFILGWPAGIIMGVAHLFGSNSDKWSEGTKTTVSVISLCIAIPIYIGYRRQSARHIDSE